MNYIDLNNMQKVKMNATCKNNVVFDWEDKNLIRILSGHLSEAHNYSSNTEIERLFSQLNRIYNSYDFFNTDINDFIKSINKLLDDIQTIEPFWSHVSIKRIEKEYRFHKCCIISGEGGIGKSFFVKCLEEELQKSSKKHLVLYGKHCKDLSVIDFDEIISVGQKEEFIFVFDAINEIQISDQLILLKNIVSLLKCKGVRVIVSYRTNKLTSEILSKIEELNGEHYYFPGVSFESVVDWLESGFVFDINEYLDVLYSNNPMLLSRLPSILTDMDKKKGKKKDKNNISRFTHIYEKYIKDTIGTENWRKTKTISKHLFNENKKSFTLQQIISVIKDAHEYVLVMEESGFLTKTYYSGVEEYYFSIESLSDYLIARTMWNEYSDIDKSIEKIKEKIQIFNSIGSEAIILSLFDKYGSDYKTIKDILEKTDLLCRFEFSTIVKIHFNKEAIEQFFKYFDIFDNKAEMILYFSGYIDKPFNCTNYLNTLLCDKNKQISILSEAFSKYFDSQDIINRLKNVLYFIVKCSCNDEYYEEIFYTALWCSSSNNEKIRLLSIKILFEVLHKKGEYVVKLIEQYQFIEDDYIRDAIILVLSSCLKTDSVSSFFETLLLNKDFLYAKSIKRITDYLSKDFCYVNYEKCNLFSSENTSPSEAFLDLLHSIELFDKNLLPFRFYDVKSFNTTSVFLDVDKKDIEIFNSLLKEDFSCVNNGNCCGDMSFQKFAETHYGQTYSDKVLDSKCFLASFEKTVLCILKKYGVDFLNKKILYNWSIGFNYSVLKKCVCIAIDLYYGSLMCNYYTDDFDTYTSKQMILGYKVYDPFEYDEDFNIKSPISIYQEPIEQLSSILLEQLDYPPNIDESWWNDIDFSKNNLLKLLKPIIYSGYEWRALAAIVSLKDSVHQERWIDNYNFFVCTSDCEELTGEIKDRYLTIEVDEYTENLLAYQNIAEKRYLCRYVDCMKHDFEILDNTSLYLPPADIIDVFQLKLNMANMTWENSNGECVIMCNNNKASYYNDLIRGTIFMRSDFFEELSKTKTIKFFAFTERFLEGKGYSPKTDFHFEIKNNQIIKMFSNSNPKTIEKPYANKQCEDCKYGLKSVIDGDAVLNILIDYGVTDDEDEYTDKQ